MSLSKYQILGIVIVLVVLALIGATQDNPPQSSNFVPDESSIKLGTSTPAAPLIPKSPPPPAPPHSKDDQPKPAAKKILPPSEPPSPYAPITPPPPPYLPAFQDPRQYVKSVVQLRCPNVIKPSQTVAGSGTIIDQRGYILTNGHLILGIGKTSGLYFSRNCDVFMASPDDLYNPKPAYTAILVSTFVSYDAAILRIVKDANGTVINPPFDIAPLRFIDMMPKVGDRVFTIGYPSITGQAFRITTGFVTGFETIGARNMIRIDALISSGNSGGALLDSDGILIGIPTATEEGQSGGYALSIRDIYSWINSVTQNTGGLSPQEIIDRPVDIQSNP